MFVFKESTISVYTGHAIGPLTIPLNLSTGRSNGKISVRHRCSSKFRRRGRIINYIPHYVQDCAQLVRIEYDPVRSGLIGLVRFLRSGFLSYIIIPAGIGVGSFIYLNYGLDVSSLKTGVVLNKHDSSKGSFCHIKPLLLYSKGAVVNNIEPQAFKGFRYCRSAGSSAKIQSVSRKLNLVELLLPSGKTLYVSGASYAVSGVVGNRQCYNTKLRKAGQNLWSGFRPTVRGVAMNPVDHPHGGGEGRTSGGRPSVSPFAVLTKGFKTISRVVRIKHKLLKRRFENISS